MTATLHSARVRTNSSSIAIRREPDELLTVLRSAALVVVVVWHWVFATIRWDSRGPHAGNPLHLVPGGFVLTWFLQVMPVFFLVGGWASKESFDRGGTNGTAAWLRKRTVRLVVPVVPLLAALLAAKVFFSPWLFGVTLLAVSPLWFLGVYVPLTLLTPVLVRGHRRSPRIFLAGSLVCVLAIQYARFILRVSGPEITVLSFLGVWGTVFQLGFFIDRIRASRRLAMACASIGLFGIVLGGACGLSLSMVTTANDTVSNMGPPTVAIVFLALFQIGLVALFQNHLCRLASRPQVDKLLRAFDAQQMKIYAMHLPIWVCALVALRTSPVALVAEPTTGWLLTRPVWLLVPGAALYCILRPRRRVLTVRL